MRTWQLCGNQNLHEFEGAVLGQFENEQGERLQRIDMESHVAIRFRSGGLIVLRPDCRGRACYIGRYEEVRVSAPVHKFIEWMDCNTELPEKKGYYLVWLRGQSIDGGPMMAYFAGEDWYLNSARLCMLSTPPVAYWTKIPAPPE